MSTSTHQLDEPIHDVDEATPPASRLAMRTPPRVSIIINNYNYGRYLRDAIDSALDQTYPHTQVIVVDDGSTDDSRAIISAYGDRVIPVFKPNGGQASTFNTGFARSDGDIIIFLDADDMLLPATAGSVAETFVANPELAKAQFRLEVVDEEGNATGEHTPPAHLPMSSGDLRASLLAFPDDIRTPPASGNAFAAWALRQILPMPEKAYGHVGADLYLFALVPLFGPVHSLPTPGGRYRVHPSNHHHATELDLNQIRQVIVWSNLNHHYIREVAAALALPGAPERESDILSVTYTVNRLASLKLDRRAHPLAGDSIPGLARQGIIAASRRFDLPRRTRFLMMAWFVMAALSPAALTRRLVTQAFYPEQRGTRNLFKRRDATG